MDNQHSALGYSAVSTFEKCPYQYKLRYIDDVEMLDDTLRHLQRWKSVSASGG